MIQINTACPRNYNYGVRDSPVIAIAFGCGGSNLYMTDRSNRMEPGHGPARTSRDEFFVFLIIVALVWPLIAVGVVGGYGFAVWMYQIVAGPPGPPKR